MRQPKRIAAVLVVAVAAGLFLFFQQMGQSTTPNIEQLPKVTVHRLDRGSIDFGALRGQPVLVTFWSITCGACVKEIPHLIELYRAYNRHGLEVIGVSGPQDLPHRLVEFVRDTGIPYPIALDIEAKARKAFGGVFLTPTTFLFAPDGKLVFKKVGAFDKVYVEQIVGDMLARDTSERIRSVKEEATLAQMEDRW